MEGPVLAFRVPARADQAAQGQAAQHADHHEIQVVKLNLDSGMSFEKATRVRLLNRLGYSTMSCLGGMSLGRVAGEDADSLDTLSAPTLPSQELEHAPPNQQNGFYSMRMDGRTIVFLAVAGGRNGKFKTMKPDFGRKANSDKTFEELRR